MATEAQRRAVKKYDAEHIKHLHLKLNRKTDNDIINHLESQESVQGYIKRLIRDDMSQDENIVKWLYELAINTHDEPISPSEIIRRIEEGGFRTFVIERKS